MKLSWKLGMVVEKAQTLDGVLYAFVVTMNDGKKKGYHYGRQLMLELKKLAFQLDSNN